MNISSVNIEVLSREPGIHAQISEDKRKGEGADALGSHLHGGARDSQTSTSERADWDCEPPGNSCHQTETELRCAHWNQTETGTSGACGGGWRLAAGSVRNTKDRVALALEARAGMPGVGRTSRMLQD